MGLLDLLGGGGAGAVVEGAEKIAEQVLPDPKAAAQNELDELRMAVDAIKAEASSADKWTSRARPSFLYVMYLFLLMALPLGLIGSFCPAWAANFESAFAGWLKAIPSDLYLLFGTGLGGYTAARTFEKVRGVSK